MPLPGLVTAALTLELNLSESKGNESGGLVAMGLTKAEKSGRDIDWEEGKGEEVFVFVKWDRSVALCSGFIADR